MVMKDGACVGDGNKTTSDELQHLPTFDSRKHDKRIVIEWLLANTIALITEVIASISSSSR